MYRKRYLAGGLIKTGKVIREAVKNEVFKKLKTRIKNFLDDAYEGKDKTLKRQEFKIRKGEALETAMKNFVKSKRFNKSNTDQASRAVKQLEKYNKQKKLEAKEYLKSKGKTKN